MVKLGKWQEVNVNFFKDEILPRYWNHTNGTEHKIIEFQFFPGLLSGSNAYRVFMGASIKPWSSYSVGKSKDLKENIIKEHGIEFFLEYERNYSLGLLMTGDGIEDHDYISIAPFSGQTHEAYQIFLTSSLGYSLKGVEDYNVALWFNPGKNGGYDFSDSNPHPDRKVRIRVLEEDDFLEIIEYFRKTKKFKKYVTKDDANV